MFGHDALEEREEGFRFIGFCACWEAESFLPGQRGGGESGHRVIFLGVDGGTEDLLSVEGEAEGGGVVGDEGVADGLVHVAVEVLVLVGGGGACGGGGGGRGVEVCEGDDVVAVGEAVEEGEEGVFAAGDKADDLEGWGHLERVEVGLDAGKVVRELCRIDKDLLIRIGSDPCGVEI